MANKGFSEYSITPPLTSLTQSTYRLLARATVANRSHGMTYFGLRSSWLFPVAPIIDVITGDRHYIFQKKKKNCYLRSIFTTRQLETLGVVIPNCHSWWCYNWWQIRHSLEIFGNATGNNWFVYLCMWLFLRSPSKISQRKMRLSSPYVLILRSDPFPYALALRVQDSHPRMLINTNQLVIVWTTDLSYGTLWLS